MRVLKKILYVILAILAALMVFIVACVLDPGLSKRTGDKLQQGNSKFVTLFHIGDKDSNEEIVLQEINSELPQEVNGTEDNSLAIDSITDSEPVDEAGDLPKISEPDLQNTSSLSSDWEMLPEEYIPDVALDIPTEVAGVYGYEPIKGQGNEIDESEAERLENQLGYGETGDGLSFDPTFYPYYAMLDNTEQHLYRQIYANAQALIGSFAPIENVSNKKLYNVFAAVYNDHPELFWLNTAYSCKYIKGGDCAEIDIEFNECANNIEESKSIFSNRTTEILSGLGGVTDPVFVEKYLHDYLLETVEYDASAPMSQSAYSALINCKSVCAGYSRAFQYLMEQQGIPCYYCTGYAGQSHAWNLVNLNGSYYNTDLTWDDNAPSPYDYYNRTDSEFATTHIRQGLSVNLPGCEG